MFRTIVNIRTKELLKTKCDHAKIDCLQSIIEVHQCQSFVNSRYFIETRQKKRKATCFQVLIIFTCTLKDEVRPRVIFNQSIIILRPHFNLAGMNVLFVKIRMTGY